jgi:hypothetical protein
MSEVLPAVRVTSAPATRFRDVYVCPPHVRFDEAGAWCPMCRELLAAGPAGWACLGCRAEWTFHGLRGRWMRAIEPAAPARRSARVSCCARVVIAAALLGAVLVPVEAVAAQTLLGGFAGTGWRLAGVTEPGVFCWLVSTVFSPGVVVLVLQTWHRWRRHRRATTWSTFCAGGAR